LEGGESAKRHVCPLEIAGGAADGKVVRKLTRPAAVKGDKAMATKENPENLVETDAGKRATHRAGALKKL
jgi:DUF2945 family protein